MTIVERLLRHQRDQHVLIEPGGVRVRRRFEPTADLPGARPHEVLAADREQGRLQARIIGLSGEADLPRKGC
jgi:hypothetical protein